MATGPVLVGNSRDVGMDTLAQSKPNEAILPALNYMRCIARCCRAGRTVVRCGAPGSRSSSRYADYNPCPFAMYHDLHWR